MNSINTCITRIKDMQIDALKEAATEESATFKSWKEGQAAGYGLAVGIILSEFSGQIETETIDQRIRFMSDVEEELDIFLDEPRGEPEDELDLFQEAS
ncbi:hypothetical protein KKI24_07175 [bacterium]|nr:hypothetical protein [bacterium]